MSRHSARVSGVARTTVRIGGKLLHDGASGVRSSVISGTLPVCAARVENAIARSARQFPSRLLDLGGES